MKIHTPLRVALLAALAAAPVAAQDAAVAANRSNTRGFTLGVHLNGSALKLDEQDAETESGGGLGLTLGYGVSNAFTLFARADGASVDYSDGGGDYALAHVDLGARYSFASSASALRPYVEVALLGAGVTDEVEGSDVSISGAGFGLGGGLEYFFSRKLALDAGLSIASGKFTDAKVDDTEVSDLEENFTSSRFNVGISWHP